MRAGEANTYCFEGFTLDLKRGCLRDTDDEIELRPKSFEVLRYLVQNAGRLVSKGELVRAVWPKVIVTDESLTRCVSDVRQALRDSDQRTIKTVRRRGYLFTAPVLARAGGAVPLDLGSRSAQVMTGAKASLPAPRLSIVVIPFTNLSRDPGQDYFVDSITDSLTTDLSRIPGLFVIARNTALAFAGKGVDARQVGRELGVRYIMEGSVQTGSDRIRINAQLVDADTGGHLWAERFDKPRTDLFDMQDEITARLAHTLDHQLVVAEARRAERKRPYNMDAIDLAMRGWAIWNRTTSIASAPEARVLFEGALRLDDRNVDALTGMSATYCFEVATLFPENPAEHIRLAEAATSKALALAPESARVHFWRGELLRVSRTPEQALREFEIAINLDPNFADAYAFAGPAKTLLGRAEEAEASVIEAIRRSPRDPRLGHWYYFMGQADLHLGRLDQAEDRLRKAIELVPTFTSAYHLLACALALAGRENEAAKACAAGQRLLPTFTITKFRSRAFSDHPVYLAQRDRLYHGMRKAGVPED